MRTFYENSRPNEVFKIAQALPIFKTAVLANDENLVWAAPVARSFPASSPMPEMAGKSSLNQPARAEACAR